MINYRAAFAIAGMAALVSTGCRGTAGLAPVGAAARLNAECSVELGGSAVAVCSDGDYLLVLEASGTRIVRLDAELVPVDTIPLTERLVGPRGIVADRFYVYVYDDRVLSRMLKEDLVLKAWLNNVRVAGLVSYTPGEMLVGDSERGVIWYKTLFGDSREFMSAADVLYPGPMGGLPDGRFCVLGGRNRLVRFNRAGIADPPVKLAGEFNLLATDAAGTVYLGSRRRSDILVLEEKSARGLQLPADALPMSFAILGDRLAVLEGDTRVSIYRLP